MSEGTVRKPPEEVRDPSRRELFRQVGITGTVVALSGTGVGVVTQAAAQPMHTMESPSTPATMPVVAEALNPRETLTAIEADCLEAIVARLIPTDENGPGAAEANVARYIDKALAGPLAASRRSYAAGLAAVDDYATSSKGRIFAELAPADQDAVLVDMEEDSATGFFPNSASFFTLLRTHTIQGMFSDPVYGGNAGFVGWDLIGYPGLRMPVEPEDQLMSRRPAPIRVSAYGDPMFTIGRTGNGN